MIGRGYSAIEAWGYERFIAAGVCDAVAPAIDGAIGAAASVLDVGCGGGAIAARLRDGGREVVGVDASIAQARRAAGVAAAAGALPFPDGTFDAVVSSCSIKHWPDAAAGVAECRRVARAGGPVVVVEMDRDASRADMARFAAMTRVPRPFRPLYVQVDLRAVLPTAPTAAQLAAWAGAPARRLDGLPYLVAIVRA